MGQVSYGRRRKKFPKMPIPAGMAIAPVSEMNLRAMNRLVLAAVLGLFLTACASAPPRLVASAKAIEFSDELECLADCLDDGEVTCEECVTKCLKSEPGTVVASRLVP